MFYPEEQKAVRKRTWQLFSYTIHLSYSTLCGYSVHALTPFSAKLWSWLNCCFSPSVCLCVRACVCAYVVIITVLLLAMAMYTTYVYLPAYSLRLLAYFTATQPVTVPTSTA